MGKSFDGFAVLKATRDKMYYIIKAFGLNVSDCFKKSDNVVIVGTSLLARGIYHDIKDKVNVIGFMDAVPSHSELESIPVWHGISEAFWNIIKDLQRIKVLVVDCTDVEDVEAGFKVLSAEVDVVLVEALMLAVYSKNLMKRKHWNISYDEKNDPLIYWNRKTVPFENILFSMSVYGVFLYTMINDNWQNDTWGCLIAGSDDITRRYMENFAFGDVLNVADECWDADADSFMEKHRMILLAEYAKKHKITVIGFDHFVIAGFFFGTNFFLLEEGDGNYNKNARMKITMPDGESYISHGYSDYIAQIILTGRKNIPAELKKKCQIVNISAIWESKTEEQKDTLRRFFGFPEQRIRDLLSKGRDHYIFTQNFCGYPGMTVKDQVEIYREILARYNPKRVVFKPHPHDFIDYKKYFPDCEVVEGFFPAEMIAFAGIKLKRVIGVNSTALYGVFSEDIIDDYPEYYEKYFG